MPSKNEQEPVGGVYFYCEEKKDFGPQKDESISSPIKYHQEVAFEIEYYSSIPLYLCLPFRVRTSIGLFKTSDIQISRRLKSRSPEVESTQFEASKLSSMCIAK